MICQVVLLAALTAGRSQDSLGAVTALRGEAAIERSAARIAAAVGDAVFAGERIAVGGAGGLSVFLRAGHVLYLGPDAAAEFLDAAPESKVRLLRGESRVVAGRNSPLVLVWERAELQLQASIVRFSVGSPNSRIFVEHGQAVLRAINGQTQILSRGQEYQITPDGLAFPVPPGDEREWTIRSSEFRDTATQARRSALEPGGGDRGGAPSAEGAPADQAESNPASAASGRGLASVSSLTLGALSGASFAPASGALFTDAANSVADPVNRHFVHLVTAESLYTLGNVLLTPADAFPQDREYWSIGLGAIPTTRVEDVLPPGSRLEPIFQTADSPTTIPIPRFDAYLLRIDHIANDPALTTPQTQSSLPNLKESVNQPVHPVISGATPLLDERAPINDRLTFALGEFALQTSSSGNPQLAVRRSDQDRRVVRNPDLPGFELEQFNSQVEFQDGLNAQGRPDRIPVAFRPVPTANSLNSLRRAALTTLMADRLASYAARTGQTRFVVDGRIIDITGYRPGAEATRPGARGK